MLKINKILRGIIIRSAISNIEYLHLITLIFKQISGFLLKNKLSLRARVTSEAICQALAVVVKHQGRLRKLGRLLRSLLAMTACF